MFTFANIQKIMQFIATAVAFPGVILTVIYFLRNLSSNRFLDKLSQHVYKNANEMQFKIARKAFRSYVKGNYRWIVKNYDLNKGTDLNEKKIGYCRLISNIRRSSGIFVIFGEVGSGKSSLMRHIALHLRKKDVKGNPKELADYDIAFVRAGLYNSTAELIDFINGLQPTSTILIDALDELNSYTNGEEKIDDIIQKLFEETTDRNYRRIIVSIRSQAISHNPLFTLIINWQNAPIMIAVDPLQKKQVLRLYKKNSKKDHEEIKKRKKNMEQLRKLFVVQEKNIFCNPFIASWTREILSPEQESNAEKNDVTKDDAIQSQNYYEILNRIIKKDMTREANKEFRTQQPYANINKDKEKKNQYVCDGWEMLWKIVKVMMNNKTTVISVSDIPKLAREELDESSSQTMIQALTHTVISRRLLRYPDPQCDGILEFMHSLIYAYLACSVLIRNPKENDELRALFWDRLPQKTENDSDTTFDTLNAVDVDDPTVDSSDISKKPDSVEWIDTLDPELRMYLCGVYTEYKHSLIYRNLHEFLEAVELKAYIKHKKGNIFAEDLIKLLKPFQISGIVLDNGIRFTVEEIERMQSERELSLQYIQNRVPYSKEIESIDTVLAFDLSRYDRILLCDNDLNAFSFDVPIQELDVTGNPIVINAISAKNETAQIERLIIDANHTGGIITAPSIQTICFRLPDVEFSTLYRDVWESRKKGADVEVLHVMRLDQNYEKMKSAFLDGSKERPEPELLQAIYELDSLTIDRFARDPEQTQTDDILSYLTVCLLYLDCAEEAQTREQIRRQIPAVTAKFSENDPERLDRILNATQHLFDILWASVEKREDPDLQRAFAQYVLWLQKTAEDKDAYAMFRLGSCYQCGVGTEKDEEQAFYWFTESAEAESAAGMSDLGRCYEKGIGTEKDEKKAFYWFTESAENGSVTGMKDLGRCYEEEIGTEKDEKKAFYWFTKSAEAENTSGMYWLGWCYEDGKGTDRNPESAFYWYRRSAENGNAAGMYSLGRCYEKEIGTEKDEKKAFYWFTKSAEAGDTRGMIWLGWCYEFEKGTDQNPELAFHWYRQSAESGNAAGMRFLGRCYKKEIGTEKDEKKAFYWYRQSAENGNAAGMYHLGWCYEEEIGTEKDEKKAFYWYRQSAENGYAAGMYYLGRCYEEEIGTEQDLGQSFHWYWLAANDDDSPDQWAVENARRSVVRFYREGIYVEKSESKAQELEQKWHLV